MHRTLRYCYFVPMKESISMHEAKKLCTAKEFEMVRASLSPGKPREVKTNLALARRARDKYASLYREQRRRIRARRGSVDDGSDHLNERTQRKLELFEHVVGRLRSQQEASTKTGAVSGTKRAKASAPSLQGRHSERSQKAHRSAQTNSKVKKQKSRAASLNEKTLRQRKMRSSKNNRQPAILAHISSRNKRQQARRDSRGKT
jgi:hypothetical protein